MSNFGGGLGCGICIGVGIGVSSGQLIGKSSVLRKIESLVNEEEIIITDSDGNPITKEQLKELLK